MWGLVFFFFKQKTAYEMRISDWSSDVCSSDLRAFRSRGDRRRLVLQLLGTEFGDRIAEFGIAVAQFVELLAVMAVDLGLDRGGAGHGGARADRGGRGAERAARAVPDRWQRERKSGV